MRFFIVDCFAEEKYEGNQLLVVLPDRAVTDEEQQKIAREIHFSETAFILSGKQKDSGYDVRIWTPHMEVPFAGHPTLGAAYVIHRFLEKGESQMVRLNLKAGQIPVKVCENGLVMSQNPPLFGECVDREEVAAVYGLDEDDIRDDLPLQWVSTGLESVIVPLKTRESLRKLRMDPRAFEEYVCRHPKNYCNHLFFADMGNGTLAARCMMEDFAEDPATGSAGGDLAGYLVRHDFFGGQEVRTTVIQGEDMGRRSVLSIHASKEGESWTIEVGGSCFVVAQGEWT